MLGNANSHRHANAVLGSVLAWGIIGPVLVKYGECVGVPNVEEDDPDFWKWSEYTNYFTLDGLDGKSTPSPRYWLLWPGVLMMLCASMVELFIQYKVIWYGIKVAGRGAAASVHAVLQKRGRTVAFLARQAEKEIKAADDQVEDPALPHEQVPAWVWGCGLVGVIALTLAICESPCEPDPLPRCSAT